MPPENTDTETVTFKIINPPACDSPIKTITLGSYAEVKMKCGLTQHENHIKHQARDTLSDGTEVIFRWLS